MNSEVLNVEDLILSTARSHSAPECVALGCCFEPFSAGKVQTFTLMYSEDDTQARGSPLHWRSEMVK